MLPEEHQVKRKILNGVMLLALLGLSGTVVEGFSRQQTVQAYARLAQQQRQAEAQGQIELVKPVGPGEPLSVDRPVSSIPTEEVLQWEDIKAAPVSKYQFQQNPNASWLAVNPDYAGWIRLPGTSIDYPYVRSRDNEEYLKKDFYGKEARSGTIFMDYRNIGGASDRHIMLYGHNMKNGTMFHDLVQFHDADFLKENPAIVVSDLYETRTYQIFSVYEISADDYTLPVEFADSPAYSAFLNDLTSRSMHPAPEGLDEDARVLTLITCSYGVDNGRTIVHAREISR